MWYTYILKSTKIPWFYVGSTNDIKRRILEHNNKKVLSTKAYSPLEVVFKKEFQTEKEAREYEKKIKYCRKEKERIIKSLYL